MEAMAQAQDNRGMQELGERLNAIHEMTGTSYSSIADATGVNRSYVSCLANKGAAGISEAGLAKLWDWVDAWDESQGVRALKAQSHFEAAPSASTPETERRAVCEAASPSGLQAGLAFSKGTPTLAEYKQNLDMIHTRDLIGALGFCDFCVKHREIGVVIGMPGTGKTTVVNIMAGKLARAIKIEAWLSMRLGDLLEEIGTGLGLELRGTLNSKTQKLIRALKQQPDTVILVDEAEYLKKWNVEKLDVLRKLHDNAGVTVLLFGTPAIANVLNRRDTTQLSRRMFQYSFTGARKDEIRAALGDYDMDGAVREHLAAIASDTAHGGMGSYTKMLELCLFSAQGGRITEETMAEAVMYKPGL